MPHEGEKQVNFWIPEDLRNHLARRAEDEKRTMTDIVTDLIREDIARRNGELVQQNTLVVLQGPRDAQRSEETEKIACHAV